MVDGKLIQRNARSAAASLEGTLEPREMRVRVVMADVAEACAEDRQRQQADATFPLGRKRDLEGAAAVLDRDAIAFAVLIVVLLIRPRGLFASAR